MPRVKLIGAEEVFVMVISDRAAQARCYVGAGVARAEFSGVVTNESAHAISRRFLDFAKGYPTLERIDTAITAFNRITPLNKLTYMRGSLPGFIVVRPDQLEDSLAYAEFLRQLGVVRTVILPSQMLLAQRWLSLQTPSAG